MSRFHFFIYFESVVVF